MPRPKPHLHCFRWAGRGIWRCLRTQRNLRLQVAIGLGAIVLGVTLRLGAVEWALVGLAIALVLACEMFNSTLEAIMDLVSPGYHELAGAAKDAGAGATLIAAAASVLVGLLVFGPRLLALVR